MTFSEYAGRRCLSLAPAVVRSVCCCKCHLQDLLFPACARGLGAHEVVMKYGALLMLWLILSLCHSCSQGPFDDFYERSSISKNGLSNNAARGAARTLFLALCSRWSFDLGLNTLRIRSLY